MAFNTPQTNLFSPNGLGVINQNWFNAAFAGRIAGDPIFRESYFCNIVGGCNMSAWIEDYMGTEVDCHPAYSLIEKGSYGQQIKVGGGANVVVPASPGTVVVPLAASSHSVGGVYVLPQVGNTIVLIDGSLAEVTVVTVTTANNTTITIRKRTAGTVTLAPGNELIVLSGSFIPDCGCPSGQFAFPDIPNVHDLEMITIGDKGSLCGDALLKCQFLKIPFEDDNGNVVEKWWTEELRLMYERFEDRKHYERLLNPIWGIIPSIKARGLNFTTASQTAIALTDILQWKRDLVAAGIFQTEFAIFASTERFIQFQTYLNAQGVTNLDYTNQPLNGGKYINMEYMGIKVVGLTLHIYEDCTFSNGKGLGGNGSAFGNAFIVVPMWKRTTNVRGETDNRMLTTVYFKDITGRVWENDTDSNGVLGDRNTFGTGCEQQEWTIKSRFLQEVHCPNMWGWNGLP